MGDKRTIKEFLTVAKGDTLKAIVRLLRPFSRVSKGAWLWDNMYCVWRSRNGRTIQDALICQFTHYTNDIVCPTCEPNAKHEGQA